MFQSYGNKKPNQVVKQQSSKKIVGALYYSIGKNGMKRTFSSWLIIGTSIWKERLMQATMRQAKRTSVFLSKEREMMWHVAQR